MRHFFIMRHGESEANVAKIISSDPAISTVTHGLTDLGKSQAAAKGAKLLEELSKFDTISFYHSDFTRARQTAEIVRDLVKEQFPEKLVHFGPDIRLRERSFGDLNGKSDDLYDSCWIHDEDQSAADPPPNNVEACSSVLDRCASLVTDICATPTEKEEAIVFVAHGDVAQIFLTGMGFEQNPRMHRVLVQPPFDKADWRFVTKK